MKLVLPRLEITVRVDLTNQEKKVGVDLVHSAYLVHTVVAEAQSDAETGQQLQQPAVVRHELGKF